MRGREAILVLAILMPIIGLFVGGFKQEDYGIAFSKR